MDQFYGQLSRERLGQPPVDAPAARVPWPRIRDLVDTLPPLPGGSRVTLEPGGQVELSAPPYPGVAAAVAALRADRDVLAAALAAAGEEPTTEATTPRKKADRRPKAEEPAAGGAAAEAPAES